LPCTVCLALGSLLCSTHAPRCSARSGTECITPGAGDGHGARRLRRCADARRSADGHGWLRRRLLPEERRGARLDWRQVCRSRRTIPANEAVGVTCATCSTLHSPRWVPLPEMGQGRAGGSVVTGRRTAVVVIGGASDESPFAIQFLKDLEVRAQNRIVIQHVLRVECLLELS
jgi:hypothetical protein